MNDILGGESRICRVFKATNQNIIAPAVIALSFSKLGQDYRYKDHKVWRVFVHINNDCVCVTNQREGNSFIHSFNLTQSFLDLNKHFCFLLSPPPLHTPQPEQAVVAPDSSEYFEFVWELRMVFNRELTEMIDSSCHVVDVVYSEKACESFKDKFEALLGTLYNKDESAEYYVEKRREREFIELLKEGEEEEAQQNEISSSSAKERSKTKVVVGEIDEERKRDKRKKRQSREAEEVDERSRERRTTRRKYQYNRKVVGSHIVGMQLKRYVMEENARLDGEEDKLAIDLDTLELRGERFRRRMMRSKTEDQVSTHSDISPGRKERGSCDVVVHRSDRSARSDFIKERDGKRREKKSHATAKDSVSPRAAAADGREKDGHQEEVLDRRKNNNSNSNSPGRKENGDLLLLLLDHKDRKREKKQGSSNSGSGSSTTSSSSDSEVEDSLNERRQHQHLQQQQQLSRQSTASRGDGHAAERRPVRMLKSKSFTSSEENSKLGLEEKEKEEEKSERSTSTSSTSTSTSSSSDRRKNIAATTTDDHERKREKAEAVDKRDRKRISVNIPFRYEEREEGCKEEEDDDEVDEDEGHHLASDGKGEESSGGGTKRRSLIVAGSGEYQARRDAVTAHRAITASSRDEVSRDWKKKEKERNGGQEAREHYSSNSNHKRRGERGEQQQQQQQEREMNGGGEKERRKEGERPKRAL